MVEERSRRTAVRAVVAGLGLGLVAGAACSSDSPSDDDPEPPGRHVVVALGDSFSSGEGAPPYDDEPERCRRSAQAWPRLLGRLTAVESVDLRACASAEVEHLIGPWTSRGLDAQIPEDPDTSVTLVLLTVGGNDIGFGDIVARCVILTCAPAPGSEALDDRLDELRAALVQEVHPALAAAFPNARIVHVGYPHLTPPPQVDPRSCIWLSTDDQRISRGIVDALNDTIAEAAQQAGTAEHLDVTDAFAGHELCSGDGWVNGVGFDAGAAHPRLAGQRALAAVVADELGLPTRS